MTEKSGEWKARTSNKMANLMNKAHKATTPKYRKGWDKIEWKTKKTKKGIK